MSGAEKRAGELVSARDGRPDSRPGTGAARLLPTVSFGLRAAVLTGVVVVTGAATTPARTPAAAQPKPATTVLLSSAIGPVQPMITCCPHPI
ncbi:MAG TPA: hypothetical protein VGS62_09975 [Streptosporangiaceae bacterium]|nr:hypothetical protein [Streptosporangiaceae bacterium]